MNTLLLAVVMTASTLTSCVVMQEGVVPSDNYETKQVEVGSFDGISAFASIDVTYTQKQGTPHVEIYAPDNLMEYVKVNVKNGVLQVGFQSEEGKGINIKGNHKTEVRVTAPAVHAFRASSSGDIIMKNGLRTTGKVVVQSASSGDIEGGDVVCDGLLIQASSSGDISLGKIECHALETDASSSGDVEIEHLVANEMLARASSAGDITINGGSCVDVRLEAASSGDVEAKELKADHVTALASSAGDISCYPVESLKAKASSGGNVGYRGNPKSIDSSKKGVHKLN